MSIKTNIIILITLINIFFVKNQVTTKDDNENDSLISNIIENAPCITDKDCNYYGKCIRSTCYCNYGVVTVNININQELESIKIQKLKDDLEYIDSDGGSGCNYIQKYQINAFLLELFPGFGIGHF